MKRTCFRPTAQGWSDAEKDKGNTMNEEQEDRGRYVEGSYGKAGSEKGHKAEETEGRYVEGDYGRAGEEEATPKTDSGRFVEADYGSAGDVPGHAAHDPKGRYVQKDQRKEKDA